MSVLFNYPFSTNFGDANVGLQANGSTGTGATLPNGIARHLVINGGVLQASITTSDTATVGGIRSECYFNPSALADQNWYSWEMLVNAADWSSTGVCSVAQVHNKDSINSAVNFLLVLANDQLQVYIPLTAPPSLSNNYQIIATMPFVYGVWNSLCLHTLWQNSSSGYIEFYFNKQLVYKNWSLATAYNSDAPYFKMGIYDAFAGKDFNKKNAFYRNLKIYSGNDGYETVMGGSPTTPLRYVSA